MSDFSELEERCFEFARRVKELIKSCKMTVTNIKIAGQLMDASGSVGANYIEANEGLSKKDFVYRIRICKKESKESRFWLRLLDCEEKDQEEQKSLIREATELMLIFGGILKKCIRKQKPGE
jgi:four helix bundle protein